MADPVQPTSIPAHTADGQVEYDAAGAGVLHLGQWVIVLPIEDSQTKIEEDAEDDDWDEEEVAASDHDDGGAWLGCVTKIGSNYAEITEPAMPHRGQSYRRIHFNDVWRELKLLTAEEAEAMLQKKVQHWSQESNRVLENIQAVARRLGLQTANALPAPPGSTGMALATLAAQQDVKAYQTALTVAKDETLPAMYKELKEAHGELARWLGAHTLSITAMAGDMTSHVEEINDRIFSLGLYAGLTENAVKIQDGKPAAMPEKLTVFQRRLFMEEECLAGYRAGGIKFTSIDQFDQWLLEPENLARILPNPRTLVAFRVRRKDWDAKLDGILSDFVQIRLENADKKTYLYVRNGDQVWRIDTALDFDDMLFPDKSVYDPSEPLMEKGARYSSRIQFMKRSEFDDRMAERARQEAENAAWEAANPEKEWLAKNPDGWYAMSVPHRHLFEYSEWRQVDPSNVYFDEAMKVLGNEVKRYNRLAVIIQGLFDRSEILHPHPPVSAWTAEGFASSIQLIYDGAMVLDDGDMPDFEGYMQQCNASLGVGSIVFGQHHVWLRAEAEREMRRRRADWRLTSDEKHRSFIYFQPHGNPGPDLITRVEEWRPRARTAKFQWTRQRQTERYDHDSNDIACSISVSATQLFNISAYAPGDYKQFFTDHRSRARYKEWAPALLAAEDYWAGMRGQNL